jgi:hypothetical protein
MSTGLPMFRKALDERQHYKKGNICSGRITQNYLTLRAHAMHGEQEFQ